MISNHSRRLDKLEEVSRPKGGVVRIWDNHTPGCVERQKARLIAMKCAHLVCAVISPCKKCQPV